MTMTMTTACCVSKFVEKCFATGLSKESPHKQGTNIGVGKSLIFVTNCPSPSGKPWEQPSVRWVSWMPPFDVYPAFREFLWEVQLSRVEWIYWRSLWNRCFPLRFSSRWRFTIYYILIYIYYITSNPHGMCIIYIYTHFFFRCWSNGMKTCCFTCSGFRLRP